MQPPQPPQPQHFDAIVVGLGGVGSMALRALSRSSSTTGRHNGSGTMSVLGVEAAPSPEQAGFSSRGATRIYRRAYFEHSSYVPWVEYSLQCIREMERESGMELHNPCGALVLEPAPNNSLCNDAEEDPNSFLPPTLQKSWDAAQQHQIPVQVLSHEQLREQFPQFVCDEQQRMMGLYEPDAGFLRCERIQQLALAQAQESQHPPNDRCSVQTMYGTRIVEIQPCSESVPSSSSSSSSETQNHTRIQLRLRTTSSTTATSTANTTSDGDKQRLETETKETELVVTTDYLLLSMGGWTSSLIPSWNSILTPIRQLQGWIDVAKHAAASIDFSIYQAGTMPCFVYKNPIMSHSLYGVPVDTDDPDHPNAIKIGTHQLTGKRALPLNSSLSSLYSLPDPTRPEEIQELQEAIPWAIHRRAWAGSGNSATTLPPLAATHSCLYTVTPDHHFVIGTPHVYRNNGNTMKVFAVAGLSGHGYKMTPALGQMMADFCTFGGDAHQVRAKWRTEFCDPIRFGV